MKDCFYNTKLQQQQAKSENSTEFTPIIPQRTEKGASLKLLNKAANNYMSALKIIAGKKKLQNLLKHMSK
jgi:hypothetical protein